MSLPSPAADREHLFGWALAALALAAPLAIVPGGRDAANLPQSALIDVGAWTLTALALWSRSVRVWPLPSWGLPLLACLAWAALSLAWAVDPREGVPLLVHFASCGLLALVIAGRSWPKEPQRIVVAALLLAGALVSALGLGQHFLGLEWLPQGIPPAATFVNKNVAAQFVLAVLPFGLAGWAAGRRVLALLAGLLSAAYLGVTFTRSAWLALGAQLVAGAVLLVPRASPVLRRRLAAASVAGILALVGLVGLTAPGRAACAHLWAPIQVLRGAAPQASESISALSARARLAVWANTLALVRDHPVAGVGLGQHRLQYPRYARAAAWDPHFSERFQLDFVHDDPLQILAELGGIGLGLALWLALAAARALARCYRATDSGARALVASVALSAIGLAVDALFSFPAERALPPFVLAVGLGLVTAAAAQRPAHALSRGWVLVPGLGAAVLAIAYGTLVRADLHLARAFSADVEDDAVRARAEALRAHALAPWTFEPVFVAASSALALRQPAEALALLRQVEARRPYDLATLGNISSACVGVADRGCAAEYARRQTVLLPDSASLQLHHGVLAYRAGERAAARSALERALALDASLAAAHKALGVLLLDEPEHKAEALAHFRQALALDPNLPDAARMRGLLDEDVARR